MRRYGALNIEQLEKLFANGSNDLKLVSELASELRIRSARRAIDLRKRVDARLTELRGNTASLGQSTNAQRRARADKGRSSNSTKQKVDQTLEQLECIDLFKATEKLKVNAFAGSGKTTTLRLLANPLTPGASIWPSIELQKTRREQIFRAMFRA